MCILLYLGHFSKWISESQKSYHSGFANIPKTTQGANQTVLSFTPPSELNKNKRVRSSAPTPTNKIPPVKLNNLNKNLSQMRRFPLNTVEKDERIDLAIHTFRGSVHVRDLDGSNLTSTGGNQFWQRPHQPRESTLALSAVQHKTPFRLKLESYRQSKGS